jgi:hypothetical protein
MDRNYDAADYNLRPSACSVVHGCLTYLRRELGGFRKEAAAMLICISTPRSDLGWAADRAFLQPAPQIRSYEGGPAELETVVTITLHSAIGADPRAFGRHWS